MSAGVGPFASLVVWSVFVMVGLPGASFGEERNGQTSRTTGGHETGMSVGETSETLVSPNPALRLSLNVAVQNLRWTPDRCYFVNRRAAFYARPTTLSQVARDDFPELPPVELALRHRSNPFLSDYAARPLLIEMRPKADNRKRLSLSPFYHPLGPQVVIPTSSFNRKRLHPVYHYVRPHYGQDYGIPAGCAIYAANSGLVSIKRGAIRVTEILERQGHGTLWESRYYHVRPIATLRSGQEVRAGDLIAHVRPRQRGTTGAHLHFELLKWAPKLPEGWSQSAVGRAYRLRSGWAFIDPRVVPYTTVLPSSSSRRLVAFQPD
jgi:hypothetical protein